MDLLDSAILEFPSRFRLVRRIAEGGMATVYEAEQLGPAGFTKRTAVKVIHPHYAKRDEFLQLFVDEAKLSANLVHGNVVQIYQLGEVSGRYFIAMEYIQGPTLRSIIERHTEIGSPMPATLAAYVVSRVCRALDFAHNFVDARGRRLDIVHRDVSPGNVMATWDGHIKLADFGIAKARTSVDPAEKRPMLMGKKYYMSPEQILGLAVDARSDVFSVGLVLFEMLALTTLFHEEITELAIDEVAVNPLPNLRAGIPNIDPELEQILMLALEKDPARRPTAAAMGHALDEWCAAQNELGTPDRLQSHLQTLFPNSFQPPSSTDAVSFPSSERESVAIPSIRSLWRRVLSSVGGNPLGG
jgi:eukaryotic-like serine/threonine-protein kinase